MFTYTHVHFHSHISNNRKSMKNIIKFIIIILIFLWDFVLFKKIVYNKPKVKQKIIKQHNLFLFYVKTIIRYTKDIKKKIR